METMETMQTMQTMETMETSTMASMFNYQIQKYGVLMFFGGRWDARTLTIPGFQSLLALNHRNLLNTDISYQGTWLKKV
ncbi:hypothetical protein BPAE_0161g00030 [Botrytis paeoniae]|uniref:Uncharacterized protein n=1 Tax=Botrytis paeoniae TaxID=278948 RepID=A0A4Z1FH33_9HELO|nr:hypothetical protein BPAE_0161g00030 [Botrytis paeoniae]